MATFHFDLVSPEKLAFSGEVDQVDIPGVEGDFGVLAGHAPVVAAIRPGILTVHTGGKKEKIIVLGGLAEVSEKGLTVLADVATSLEELDRARLADAIAEMEAKLAEKEGGELDRALERLDHYKSVQQQVSVDGDALDPGASRIRGFEKSTRQIQRPSHRLTGTGCRLRGTSLNGILRQLIVVRGCLHETQDRGDFCGRYCRLQPTGRRGRRGDAAAARLLPAGDRRLHRQMRRTHLQHRG